jgi:hypothetical protein
MSSDRNFRIYRQFAQAQLEVILYYQLEVSKAEKALNDFDEEKCTSGVSSFDDEERNKLLTALDRALLDYSKIT